ncbi:MAG: hypothetical protein WB816_18785 [Methylocystis sp.]
MGCVAVLVVSLAPLVYVRARAPAELEPLRVNSQKMWRWVSEGEYALVQAAAEGRRFELQHAAELQTHIAFVMIFALCAYGLWRGLNNERPRAWSPFFWAAGIGLVFFAPTFAPDLTPRRIDYLTTFWMESEDAAQGNGYSHVLAPTAILAARAATAAAAAVFLALCAHDIAHRFREALWEFGFLSDDGEFFPGARTAGHESARTRPRMSSSTGGLSRAESDDRGDDARRFGHREAADLAALMANPRAQACATLGVRLGASRAEIERAYRAKMKRAHPDHGGSVARAAALNMARDLLLPHG